jgi:hypothetical protein
MANSGKFIEFFNDLVEKASESDNPNVLFVFERKEGEFYTAHGDAAFYIADEFFKTRDVVK